ncbi:unnamed protein product, partial [Phyllotreta striolata]
RKQSQEQQQSIRARFSNMKSCETSVIKYALFIFNLFFAVSGIGLIIAGALILSDIDEFGHFFEGKISAPAVVLIVAGCIVFFVAFLGCYGALRESYYMLIGFAVCLLVIFIVEFAVGIAAATYKSQFQGVLKESMARSLGNYEANKADKVAWDTLQSKLECCGVDGPTDWKRRPDSCCASSPRHCQDLVLLDSNLYSYGCFQELQSRAESSAKVLIGVGIGIAFVEIIGIILALWMASAVKDKN